MPLTVLQPGQVPPGFYDYAGAPQQVSPLSRQQPQGNVMMTADEASEFFELGEDPDVQNIHPEVQSYEQKNWYSNFARLWSKKQFNSVEEYVDWATKLRDADNVPLMTPSNRSFIQKKVEEHMPRHIRILHEEAMQAKKVKKARVSSLNQMIDEVSFLDEAVKSGRLPAASEGMVWGFDKRTGRPEQQKVNVDRGAVKQKQKLQDNLDALKGIASHVGGIAPQWPTAMVPDFGSASRQSTKLWTKLPPGSRFTKPGDLSVKGGIEQGFRRVTSDELRDQISEMENELGLEARAGQPEQAQPEAATGGVQQYKEGQKIRLQDGGTAVYLQDPQSGTWNWVRM